MPPVFVSTTGSIMANAVSLIQGPTKKSKFLQQLIFGGKAFDFFFSFLIGMGEQLLLSYMTKKKLSRFLKNVFASFYVSTCSILLLFTGLPILQDKIVIGSIMALVPGITFTTSIRDFHNGDYLSGTIHLIDALLTALCVAVGICLPLAIYGYLKGVTL